MYWVGVGAANDADFAVIGSESTERASFCAGVGEDDSTKNAPARIIRAGVVASLICDLGLVDLADGRRWASAANHAS